MRKAVKIKNSDDATKWECHRNRGLLFWKVSTGLLTAVITCLSISIILLFWFTFNKDISTSDWISNFISQNVICFVIGYIFGHSQAVRSWKAREEQYQAYLKNQTKIITDE